MRTVRRLLILAGIVGVGAVGFVVSMALGSWLASGAHPLAFFSGFLSGLFLTAVIMLLLRQIASRGHVKCDSVGWTHSKAERRLHPIRRKCRRIAMHVLVWMPSAMAALVLFFFPLVTHLVRPGSRYLRHYSVPIPWSFMVLPRPGPLADDWGNDVLGRGSGTGRFGMTPAGLLPWTNGEWMGPEQLSWMSFMNARVYSIEATVMEARSRGIDLKVLSREFKLGSIEVTCYQYRPYWPSAASVWSVLCQTSGAAHQNDFTAQFHGREEDLHAFYEIIEAIRPLK
jgi:hypothetical protein